VKVSRLQIQVVVMMSVICVAVVVMMRFVFQHKGADEIDRQPRRRDKNRLAKLNDLGRQQTVDGLARDDQGDDGQDDRARKTAQHADLARAKGEPFILRVAASKRIRHRRQHKRRDMSAHVPAIRRQRHRVEKIARDDLHRHHRGGQCHHDARALFGGGSVAGKIMFVLPG